MAVSIRDIAREAGVTVGTVSRALNNYPDVSPTTRERIVETAQRLGYRPNQMARNLSSKHNHNIALVLSGDPGNAEASRLMGAALGSLPPPTGTAARPRASKPARALRTLRRPSHQWGVVLLIGVCVGSLSCRVLGCFV